MQNDSQRFDGLVKLVKSIRNLYYLGLLLLVLSIAAYVLLRPFVESTFSKQFGALAFLIMAIPLIYFKFLWEKAAPLMLNPDLKKAAKVARFSWVVNPALSRWAPTSTAAKSDTNQKAKLQSSGNQPKPAPGQNRLDAAAKPSGIRRKRVD